MIKYRDEREINKTLKMIAPGTVFREGLNNVLRAKTGALIVLGASEEIKKILSGGFHIDAGYSPYNLYELAKMDGAVIISDDLKKIMYANVELNPPSDISTRETGIRHRTAERVAKLTGQVVLSVSQRRDVVTIYKGEIKYLLNETSRLLTKANQAIQTLEKYKSVLGQDLINLSNLEVEDNVTVSDVCQVIKRAEMVFKIGEEIDNYIVELGDEGRLVRMQLEELISGLYEDLINIIKDFSDLRSEEEIEVFFNTLSKMKTEDVLDLTKIARLLGHDNDVDVLDKPLYSKGYRMLSKIPRLPSTTLKNLVSHFDDFQGILNASLDQLEEVDGIGQVRARSIVMGLRRVTEKIFTNQVF